MIVFDSVFDELARESESSAKMQMIKVLSVGINCKKRLVLTGIFDVKDALTIIDEMVRIRKIKVMMLNTYRRSSSNSNNREHSHL